MEDLTGYDAASTQSATLPATNVVTVIENTYDPTLAMAKVWNYEGVSTEALDLSAFVDNGNTYQIRHVYDWDGAMGQTEYTGTYSGPVTVSLDGWVAPKPIGFEANPAPVSSAPDYNVFIITKTN